MKKLEWVHESRQGIIAQGTQKLTKWVLKDVFAMISS